VFLKPGLWIRICGSEFGIRIRGHGKEKNILTFFQHKFFEVSNWKKSLTAPTATILVQCFHFLTKFWKIGSKFELKNPEPQSCLRNKIKESIFESWPFQISLWFWPLSANPFWKRVWAKVCLPLLTQTVAIFATKMQA
jgi:hypothetical protein